MSSSEYKYGKYTKDSLSCNSVPYSLPLSENNHVIMGSGEYKCGKYTKDNLSCTTIQYSLPTYNVRTNLLSTFYVNLQCS